MAARCMVDFVIANPAVGPSTIVHLVHPKPVSLSSVMQIVSDELSVPTVPYEQWLRTLEGIGKSSSGHDGSSFESQAVIDFPALRLLDFYRRVGSVTRSKSDDKNVGEAFGLPCLSISRALTLSPTLSDNDVEMLGENDVKRWLAYWRKNEMEV